MMLRKWRGRRLRYGVLLLLLGGPFLLLGSLNLVLATDWGLIPVTSRLERKTGLQVSIERISWTPWSGGKLCGLTFRAPEDFLAEYPLDQPVFVLAEAELDLSLRALLRKQVWVEDLELRGGKLEMPVELLISLAKKSQGASLRIAPERGAGPVAEGGEVPGMPSGEQGGKRQNEQVAGAEAQPPTKSRPLQEGEKQEQGKVAGEASTVRKQRFLPKRTPVRLRDFGGRIYSIRNGKSLLEGKGVEAGFALQGKAGKGSFSWEGLSLAGEEMGRFQMPLRWTGSVLEGQKTAYEAPAGLKVNLGLRVRPVQGVPFFLSLTAPGQSLSLSRFRGWLGGRVGKVGRLSSASQMTGFLLHPGLVSGRSRTLVQDLTLLDPDDGSEVFFSEGAFSARLTPAGLQVPEARLLGPFEALLGRGWLTKGGEGQAVLRLVADPEQAGDYQKRLRESRQFNLAMRPLQTPDRYYSDVLIQRREGVVTLEVLDPGEGGRDDLRTP